MTIRGGFWGESRGEGVITGPKYIILKRKAL